MRLSKYKPFYKGGLLNLMAYKFNLWTWVLIFGLQILATLFLWKNVFLSAPDGMDSVINGFTFKEMITYLILSNIYAFVTVNSDTLGTIDDEIKDGTIALSFIKPISYRLRFVFTSLGIVTGVGLVIGLPCFTAALVTFYFTGFMEFHGILNTILYMLLFICCQLTAVILSDCVNYIFGIICFYTLNAWGLNQMKEVIIMFLSGQMLPLAFFPGKSAQIVQLLPFAGIIQNPILILQQKVSLLQALGFIGRNIIWLIIFELFAAFLFNQASKKITVQGG